MNTELNNLYACLQANSRDLQRNRTLDMERLKDRLGSYCLASAEVRGDGSFTYDRPTLAFLMCVDSGLASLLLQDNHQRFLELVNMARVELAQKTAFNAQRVALFDAFCNYESTQ